MSLYSGMLLISCADITQSGKYEDFAFKAYGPKMMKVTAWSIIIILLGFVISYITFVKQIIPSIIKGFIFGPDSTKKLPVIFGDDPWKGQIFWAFIYCALVLFPLSLP